MQDEIEVAVVGAEVGEDDEHAARARAPALAIELAIRGHAHDEGGRLDLLVARRVARASAHAGVRLRDLVVEHPDDDFVLRRAAGDGHGLDRRTIAHGPTTHL